MLPTTPVRGRATSANDAPVAPRRGRPPKPTEKIREAQATLGLRAAGARATTQRTILPAIAVASLDDQQNDDRLNMGERAEERAKESHQPTEWQKIIMEDLNPRTSREAREHR